jgi:iron complex transport system permease protein
VWWIAGSILVLLAALLLGAMIGPAGPVWWRVPLALLDHLPGGSVDSGVTDAEWNVIWQIRMPRVVLAGIVGGMLALAGASYQGVFRNPLVDPYLLGAAAGAGLGATIVLTVGRDATSGWPVDPAPAMAFLTAIATVLLTYTVGAAFGGARTGVTLVLAGVAVVSFVTAVQTFILQRHAEVVREVYSWILGTLSTARWADVRLAVPYVIVCSIVLLLHRRHRRGRRRSRSSPRARRRPRRRAGRGRRAGSGRRPGRRRPRRRASPRRAGRARRAARAAPRGSRPASA